MMDFIFVHICQSGLNFNIQLLRVGEVLIFYAQVLITDTTIYSWRSQSVT
jgi:hypothetical protein